MTQRAGWPHFVSKWPPTGTLLEQSVQGPHPEAAWQWLAADEVLPLGRGLMRLMPGKPGLALRLLLLQVLLLLSWFHVDVALSGEARW